MNGSRSPSETPANARRTGKPSPSKPRGAVVIDRTARNWLWRGSRAVTRGSARTLSGVMAGIVVRGLELKVATRYSLRRRVAKLGRNRRGALEQGGQKLALHR